MHALKFFFLIDITKLTTDNILTENNRKIEAEKVCLMSFIVPN